MNDIDDPEFYQRILTIMHTFYVGIYKLFLNTIFAFVYVFVFFKTRDEPTRHLYWIFYGICLVQNSFFTFFSLDLQGPKVIIWISLVSYCLFILGIVFMITYYKWFHPSMKFSTVIDALKHSMSLGQPKTYVQPHVSNGCNANFNNV
ncbi:unnamed protein product [Allacma fusca]|uniref:XK-related protein n=1 Tax=Allacma fusca TaxID=39272 RepID=A0A8J2L5K2_9HEXA|nr:unnamed protein product [Allacma fusca]